MIYICILYWKYPQTSLETLYSHFQPNCHFKMFKNLGSELKFLKILKCHSAESASAGFQFNCLDIFNDKTLNYRFLDHLSGLLKFIQKNLFSQQTNTIACQNPVVLSDLWKDSSSRKVDFSAYSKCLRIRAQVFTNFSASVTKFIHYIFCINVVIINFVLYKLCYIYITLLQILYMYKL